MIRNFDKKEKQFLIENAEKFGAFICAQKLNRKFGSVLGFLRRNGIKYKYKKTTATQEEINKLCFVPKKVNIDFNKNENKKELAYFLGFFWAR